MTVNLKKIQAFKSVRNFFMNKNVQFMFKINQTFVAVDYWN